jgi:GNAT superfamily N-acetyltransferase
MTAAGPPGRPPIEVDQVSPEAVLPLRGRVLRPGQPPATWRFDSDAFPDSFHLGARLSGARGGDLLAVASFYPDAPPPALAAAGVAFEPAWRLRGMATDPDHRDRGLGRALMVAARDELLRRGARLLWCNARTGAQGFYASLGLGAYGPVFDIPGIGPHVVMAWDLSGDAAEAAQPLT